jgi:hypothetical protein
MYERDEEPNAGFAAGLITGAIVGAGLALLLAPKSGAALRDELGESSMRWNRAPANWLRRLRVKPDRSGVSGRETTRRNGTPLALNQVISAWRALCGPTFVPRPCEWEASFASLRYPTHTENIRFFA